MRHIHTVRDSNNENKGLLFMATWVNPTNKMLAERWLTQENTYCIFHLKFKTDKTVCGVRSQHSDDPWWG